MLQILLSSGIQQIWISAINSDLQTVVTGTTESIDLLINTLQCQTIESSRLPVDFAFHSPLMDPMLREFSQSLQKFYKGIL